MYVCYYTRVLYIYIYAQVDIWFMCVCFYSFIYFFACLLVSISISTFRFLHLHLFICTYFMYVCMYVCIYVCNYVGMHLWKYGHMYVSCGLIFCTYMSLILPRSCDGRLLGSRASGPVGKQCMPAQCKPIIFARILAQSPGSEKQRKLSLNRSKLPSASSQTYDK